MHLIFFLSMLFTPFQTAQTCDVSDVHLETFDEHESTLLRLSVAFSSGGLYLNDPDVATVYFDLLMSMREHHRDLRTDLPACAQGANVAMLDSISEGQEVMGLIFAREAFSDGDERSFNRNIARATDQYRESYSDLVRAMNAVGIAAAP